MRQNYSKVNLSQAMLSKAKTVVTDLTYEGKDKNSTNLFLEFRRETKLLYRQRAQHKTLIERESERKVNWQR